MSQSGPWQRLSTGDLMTLWAETPTTPMNVAMLGLLDQAPLSGDLDQLRDAIADRLDRAPSLRHRIWPAGFGRGRPFWADDPDFDLTRHVDRVDRPDLRLDRLLSWAATEAATQFDYRRPLWRLRFISGLPTGEVGVLLVMHHAIADGVTAARLTGALLDPGPETRATPTSWTPSRPPAAGTLLQEATVDRLRLAGSLLHGLPAVRRDLRVARTALRVRAPELSLPMPHSTGRQLVALRWALPAARELAHAHEATVNDLMLAAVAAGLRRLLEDRAFPVDGVSLRVSVPVAAPAGARNAGGTLPIMVSIPVGDPDPISTLRFITAITSRAKAERDRGYAGPAASLPLPLVRLGIRQLRRHGGSRINLYLTNVPGPAQPRWLCGARLRTAYPIAPIAAGVPLAVAVLSYDDTVCLTVNADLRLNLRPFTAGAGQAVEQLVIAPEPAVGRLS